MALSTIASPPQKTFSEEVGMLAAELVLPEGPAD
jgi:hypothetical protein